jgi:hypothetical protein
MSDTNDILHPQILTAKTLKISQTEKIISLPFQLPHYMMKKFIYQTHPSHFKTSLFLSSLQRKQ